MDFHFMLTLNPCIALNLTITQNKSESRIGNSVKMKNVVRSLNTLHSSANL